MIGNIDLIREGLRHLPQDEAKLIARRWGLAGEPPKSIAELAREEGVAPIQMARRLQILEAKLLQAMSRNAVAGPGARVPGSGPLTGAPGIIARGPRPGPQAAGSATGTRSPRGDGAQEGQSRLQGNVSRHPAAQDRGRR